MVKFQVFEWEIQNRIWSLHTYGLPKKFNNQHQQLNLLINNKLHESRDSTIIVCGETR